MRWVLISLFESSFNTILMASSCSQSPQGCRALPLQPMIRYILFLIGLDTADAAHDQFGMLPDHALVFPSYFSKPTSSTIKTTFEIRYTHCFTGPIRSEHAPHSKRPCQSQRSMKSQWRTLNWFQIKSLNGWIGRTKQQRLWFHALLHPYDTGNGE